MPRVTFIDRSGVRHDLVARSGETLLSVARRFGIAIEGACGGALCCGTCHVIVAPSDYGRLPAARKDEEEMLDLAFGLTPTSRLGCQVAVSDGLDGLTVSLPPLFGG